MEVKRKDGTKTKEKQPLKEEIEEKEQKKEKYVLREILDTESYNKFWRYLSFWKFCQSGRFLGIGSLVFSNFWDGVRNPYDAIWDSAGDLWKKFFCSKNEKNRAKLGFFEFIGKFGY